MTEMNKQTVAAVVVTYNRLELLKQCIQSLRNQTRKLDEIIVVNNNSTDGTLEWLNSQNDLTVITQENSGSAGGQYTGIKTAYEKGYDWVWCFDDDCIPDPEVLKSLCTYLDNETVLNSLVVSSVNPDKLAFGLYEKQKKKYYYSLDDIGNFNIIESQNFFNGSIFPRSILTEIGYPLIALFIRGDEFEYYLRLLEKGFRVNTITNSIVYHPPEKKRILKNKLFYHEFSYLNSEKRYYHIRNLLYIVRHYKSLSYKYFIKNFILDLFFIILLQGKLPILINHFRGAFSGLTNNLRNLNTY